MTDIEYLCKVCGLRYTEDEVSLHVGFPHPVMMVSEDGRSVPIGSKNMRVVKDEDI